MITQKQPMAMIPRTVPHLGSRLFIRTAAFGSILGCLVAAYFIIFCLDIWTCEGEGVSCSFKGR